MSLFITGKLDQMAFRFPSSSSDSMVIQQKLMKPITYILTCLYMYVLTYIKPWQSAMRNSQVTSLSAFRSCCANIIWLSRSTQKREMLESLRRKKRGMFFYLEMPCINAYHEKGTPAVLCTAVTPGRSLR